MVEHDFAEQWGLIICIASALVEDLKRWITLVKGWKV